MIHGGICQWSLFSKDPMWSAGISRQRYVLSPVAAWRGEGHISSESLCVEWLTEEITKQSSLPSG